MQVFLYFCTQIEKITMTLSEYIEQHSSPESEVLQQITRSTHLEVINPRMLSGHVQGRVLSMLSQMIQPKRILELGTFTGYSALCLAEGLSENGKLITIEHNDEMEDSIRRNLALSPLGEKIELKIGEAKEILKQFGYEIANQSNENGEKHEKGKHIQTLQKRMDVLFCCAGMFCDWLRKSVQLGKICKTWLRRDQYDRNT